MIKNLFHPTARLASLASLASLLALALCLAAPAARAQVYTPGPSAGYYTNGFTAVAGAQFTLTNLPATLGTNAGIYTTNIVPLTKNCALALSARFNTSSSTANGILAGSFSVDGTNFGCAPFLLVGAATTTAPANGVTCWTNFTQNQLAGFCALNITAATNSAAVTLTNLGVVANRPTLNTATY